MDQPNTGVVVVTGAVAGIGRATAVRFAKGGYAVACVDVQDAGPTVAAVRAVGGAAEGFACDVRREDQVERTMAAIAAWRRPIRALVNGAAPFDPTIKLSELKLAEWQIVLDVHLTGAFLMSRAVLPELERAGGGSIVSIASNMAHVAAIGRTPYCTAKGGLVQFTKALALELATKKIRVNTVSPGGTLTERVIRRAGTEQAARDGAAKLHPMGRIGEAHEVAEAIFFMSSDAASFVTGTDLLVDGGYCAI